MDDNEIMRTMLSFGEDSKLYDTDPAAWYESRIKLREFLERLGSTQGSTFHRVVTACYQFGLTDDEKFSEHNHTIVQAVLATVRAELESLLEWTRQTHTVMGPVNAYYVAAMCHLQAQIKGRIEQTHVGE